MVDWGKAYMVEDKMFFIGREHLLSADELAWLNAKLVEMHCLPIGAV